MEKIITRPELKVDISLFNGKRFLFIPIYGAIALKKIVSIDEYFTFWDSDEKTATSKVLKNWNYIPSDAPDWSDKNQKHLWNKMLAGEYDHPIVFDQFPMLRFSFYARVDEGDDSIPIANLSVTIEKEYKHPEDMGIIHNVNMWVKKTELPNNLILDERTGTFIELFEKFFIPKQTSF